VAQVSWVPHQRKWTRWAATSAKRANLNVFANKSDKYVGNPKNDFGVLAIRYKVKNRKTPGTNR
jgi:hypothetical protein